MRRETHSFDAVFSSQIFISHPLTSHVQLERGLLSRKYAMKFIESLFIYITFPNNVSELHLLVKMCYILF